jgi:Ca-activated chloride channel family protein
MLSFQWPWFALLLPLPLLVYALRLFARRKADPELASRQPALLHPALERLGEAFSSRPRPVSPTSWWQWLLLAMLWVALVTAMMRPQWLELHTEVSTEGYDLLLAIDVSRSMEALDFTVEGRRVTRLSVVKGVAGRFIEGRSGDRIGLVLFGSHAYVLSPLTLDVQAVRALLDGIETRIAGDGTAMGDAIGLGVKKLRERPAGSRIMVLVTDGESTMGSLPPQVATRLAADEGIRIYTIGVGSMGLVPIFEDGQLKHVHMALDEPLLKEIASISGGAYFRATDTGALEAIYGQIDNLEKTQSESRSVMIPTPLYRWPLGVALVVLLLLGLFPDGIRRPVMPRRQYG